ncbi:CYTH domain-containing protein [Pontixanthobacter aquaemixtae]|uniref:Adenylate cyclase n=1 Tax=Pontixanthobacter aquaemixtae TaxID=1958940 RepID=A0A844ZTZ1_9SPHN|nr:CYTH domain-containing protein [Pontixanthobacter aquaemixtae]MXO90590.1 adenylate cyclase [Pontixanthobacter aquaemixtae]
MVEIERKFLVIGDTWMHGVTKKTDITQGYLSRSDGRSVRIRTMDEMAFITIKVGKDVTARQEFEFEMPFELATSLLGFLDGDELIKKTRHLVPLTERLAFEVDEFHGELDGLLLAEIELQSVGQRFPRPEWLGGEVTHDPAFLNENLARSYPQIPS